MMEKEFKDSTCEDEFINELINKSRESDWEFKKYVNRNLFAKQSNLRTEEIIKNICHLERLSSVQYSMLLSRAESLEKSSQLSQYTPMLIGIFTIILSTYALLFEWAGVTYDSGWIYIGVSAASLSILVYLFVIATSYNRTAVYLCTLLRTIRSSF